MLSPLPEFPLNFSWLLESFLYFPMLWFHGKNCQFVLHVNSLQKTFILGLFFCVLAIEMLKVSLIIFKNNDEEECLRRIPGFGTALSNTAF